MPDPTFMQRLTVRLLVPFYIPVILVKQLFMSGDHNMLIKRKEEKLSGVLNVCSSE